MKITSEKRREKLVPYLFIAPFIIAFIVFFVIPSGYSLVLSFFKYKGYGTAKYVGIDNYNKILHYGNHIISTIQKNFILHCKKRIPRLHRHRSNPIEGFTPSIGVGNAMVSNLLQRCWQVDMFQSDTAAEGILTDLSQPFR